MALQKRLIEHIKIWQASELTQMRYCQQHGLNAKTFSRWFKTYHLVLVGPMPRTGMPVSRGMVCRIRCP